MTFRLQTTRERGRVLSQVLREAGKPAAQKVRRPSGRSGPIIAKITTAIASGDYSLQNATLMDVVNGAIVSTGQTIQVRHVGEGSVSANTIVVPEPCGTLGLCFVRQSAGTPVVGTTGVNRYQKVMYPILDDPLEQANANWKMGSQWNAPFGVSGGGFGYYLDQDLGATPDGFIPGGEYWWDKYLYPIRFRIYSHNDGYKGGSGVVRTRNPRVLASPLEQLMFGLKDVGISSLTPGPNTHFAPMQMTHAQPHLGCFYHMTTHSYFSTAHIRVEAWVTHLRVWINEVDATGIVASGQKIVSAGPDQSRFYYGDLHTAPVALTTPGVYESDTVWIDFWIRVKMTQYGGSGVPAGWRHQMFWAHSNGGWNTPSLLYAEPNTNRAATDDYEFTLSSAGPGSVTTITTADGQADWQRIQSAYSYRMNYVPGGSNGGFILFDWNREHPYIQLGWNSKVGTPTNANGVALYFPQDTSDYDALIYANGTNYKRGVWSPGSVTTFKLAAVRIQNVWSFRYSESAGTIEPYMTGWPETITVEKL